MSWQEVAVFAVIGTGIVGSCLIAFAFMLIANQGGWQNAMQKPIAERRWPLARCLMMAGAALGIICPVGWFVLGVIPGGLPWTGPAVENDVRTRLIGKWEMADGSDYVIEFTREGTMSVSNVAGEPQVLMAGNEHLPYTFVSENVVEVRNRATSMPESLVAEEREFMFLFEVSIDQDRLTLRGRPEGETIVLSQDGNHEVQFPGSTQHPLEFIRRR